MPVEVPEGLEDPLVLCGPSPPPPPAGRPPRSGEQEGISLQGFLHDPPAEVRGVREDGASLGDEFQEGPIALDVGGGAGGCGRRQHDVGSYVVEEVDLEVAAFSAVGDSGGVGDQEVGASGDFRSGFHCPVFEADPRPVDRCGAG